MFVKCNFQFLFWRMLLVLSLGMQTVVLPQGIKQSTPTEMTCCGKARPEQGCPCCPSKPRCPGQCPSDCAQNCATATASLWLLQEITEWRRTAVAESRPNSRELEPCWLAWPPPVPPPKFC